MVKHASGAISTVIEPSRGCSWGARPSDLEQAPVKVVWLVGSCQETGVPLELLGSALEATGFARMTPDEPIREDELEVVPPLQLGLATGIVDQVWSAVGRNA